MKKIICMLFVAAATIACTDDDIRTEQNFSQGPKIVGFASPLAQVAYFEDLGTVERGFPITYIGTGNGQTSGSPVVVHYEIDPASTATEGNEFDFVDQSGIVTIEPNGTFVNFPLLVNTGNLNPTSKTELILNLTSADGAVVGAQYKKLKIVFVGCQSQLAGNYQKITTWNNGANGFTRTDEVLTLVGTNTFRTRYVGNWAVGTFTPAGYELIDICGEITLPTGQTLGGYTNEVIGVPFTDGVDYHGLVAPDGQSFQTTYDVVPYPGLPNRVFKVTYNRL